MPCYDDSIEDLRDWLHREASAVSRDPRGSSNTVHVAGYHRRMDTSYSYKQPLILIDVSSNTRRIERLFIVTGHKGSLVAATTAALYEMSIVWLIK